MQGKTSTPAITHLPSPRWTCKTGQPSACWQPKSFLQERISEITQLWPVNRMLLMEFPKDSYHHLLTWASALDQHSRFPSSQAPSQQEIARELAFTPYHQKKAAMLGPKWSPNWQCWWRGPKQKDFGRINRIMIGYLFYWEPPLNHQEPLLICPKGQTFWARASGSWSIQTAFLPCWLSHKIYFLSHHFALLSAPSLAPEIALAVWSPAHFSFYPGNSPVWGFPAP